MNSEDRVDKAFAEIRGQRWSGPERDERIERLIREVSQMKQAQSNKRFSKGMLIAVGVAGLLGGGAVAGVVTHQIMAQRVVMVDEQGNQFEGVLTPTPEGASGRFITDDGTVYGIEMDQTGAQKNVTVDVSGNVEGSSTLIIDPAEFVDTPELEIEDDGGN